MSKGCIACVAAGVAPSVHGTIPPPGDGIEIGAPDAARLHKAAKTADRVAVYTHKDPASLLRRWAGERIHRAGEIPVYGFERQFLDGFAALLERRMSLHLSVSGRQLYLDVAGRNLTGAVSEHRIA